MTISVEIKRKGNGMRTQIVSYDFKFLNKKKIKEISDNIYGYKLISVEIVDQIEDADVYRSI